MSYVAPMNWCLTSNVHARVVPECFFFHIETVDKVGYCAFSSFNPHPIMGALKERKGILNP